MGESTGCCNKCQNWLIILLLALNTFFLGSIWCSLNHCGYKTAKGLCPISGQMMSSDPSKMMCPITKDMIQQSQNADSEPKAQ